MNQWIHSMKINNKNWLDFRKLETPLQLNYKLITLLRFKKEVNKMIC